MADHGMMPSARKARIEELCRSEMPRATSQWLVEENDKLKRQLQVARYALLEISDLSATHLDEAPVIADKALKEII